MATENSVSHNFLSMFVDSINIFDCHLPNWNVQCHKVFNHVQLAHNDFCSNCFRNTIFK